jgi:hypothetical protein
VPERETCKIDDLAADGADNGLNGLDKIDTQAAIVYILAVTIKAISPTANYTDICALAKSLQKYDGLPDYARNAALIEAWSEVSENTTGEELNWNDVLKAIPCAHCCDVTVKSMQSAMTFLLCTLSSLLQEV